MLYRSIYPQVTLSADKTKREKHLGQVQPIKFPEDIQIILRSDRQAYGNLYIGNIQAAQNTQLLEKLKIDAVLSVAQGQQVNHPKHIVRHICYIPFPEDENAQINEEILESVAFLENSLIVTNVLVHCISGGCRSSIPVMAFLIKSRRISSEDAESEVKNRRKIIDISDNIRYQLKKYELDLNNTSPRKRKYNYSMRVQTKKSKTPQNKSYFESQILESEGSVVTGANDPKNQSNRVKSHQNKSKSFTNQKNTGIIINSPKMYTKAENPEHSFRDESKDWKSMMVLHNITSANKTKTLQKTIRMPSEAPSFKSHKEPIQIQALNSEGSQIMPRTQLLMTKKRSKSRQQFENKLKTLDSRNDQINKRLFIVQDNFEKTNEANKLLLECELKQIKMIEEEIIRQHQNRSSMIKYRAKTYRDSQAKSSGQYESMSNKTESKVKENTISSSSELGY